MAGDWPKVILGDISEVVTGFPFRSTEYAGPGNTNGPRLLRGDNVAQGWIRWDGVKRWTRPIEAVRQEYWLAAGDIVLAMDRPWIEAGLKYAALTPYDLPALLVQRVARLRGSSRLDTRFLKYIIASKAFTDHVLAVQTGTGVPHISREQIRSFEFRLPPVSEQRAIAAMLGYIDQKIELNGRMSETLEAMARALFKSWFVDFDPVRAKAEGRWRKGESLPGLPAHLYDLFPDSFENSELGEIPKGWRVGTFHDVAELSRITENPAHFPEKLFAHHSIPAFDEGKEAKLEFGGEIKSQKFIVPENAVLISKLNPEIPRVWLVDVRSDSHPVCSTEFLVFRPHQGFNRVYLYCLALSPAFRRRLEGLVTGTSKSHQRAQSSSVSKILTVMPPSAVVRLFELVASPMLARTLTNTRENRTLSSMRDALLPKLISGELRLDTVNNVVAGAAI